MAQVLASIGAALALVISAVIGAFVFLMALGLLLLLAIGVAIRVWWLRRQFRRQQVHRGGPVGQRNVIEGEYVVRKGTGVDDE